MTTLAQAWIAFSNANAHLAQFGQADDESTWNGSTGCSHSVMQRLVKAKTGRQYSHDEISQVASYPWPAQNPRKRGMYSGGSDDEAGRVFRAFGLPYRVAFGLSYDTLRQYVNRGPVMFAVRYGYWPDWKGYRYGTIWADGTPNGYAVKAGRTQLSGAEWIYHATLVLPGVTHVSSSYLINVNEPNHGSGSRPEKPVYDTVRLSQLKKAYEAYAIDHNGSGSRTLVAWVPTIAAFRPKGY